jgi:cytochrome c nitrite reductase small subunit
MSRKPFWTPRARLLVLSGLLLGAPVGVGLYTFVYAKGASYLVNDPASCANCHVMQEQYDGWLKGSHRNVATCNDCHTPHDPVGKYVTKARNGFWHSFHFTRQDFHEPIRITKTNRAITENACRHCHEDVTAAMGVPHAAGDDDDRSCLKCHHSVGHMELGAISLPSEETKP